MWGNEVHEEHVNRHAGQRNSVSRHCFGKERLKHMTAMIVNMDKSVMKGHSFLKLLDIYLQTHDARAFLRNKAFLEIL